MIELVQGRAHKKVSVEFAKKNSCFEPSNMYINTGVLYLYMLRNTVSDKR